MSVLPSSGIKLNGREMGWYGAALMTRIRRKTGNVKHRWTPDLHSQSPQNDLIHYSMYTLWHLLLSFAVSRPLIPEQLLRGRHPNLKMFYSISICVLIKEWETAVLTCKHECKGTEYHREESIRNSTITKKKCRVLLYKRKKDISSCVALLARLLSVTNSFIHLRSLAASSSWRRGNSEAVSYLNIVNKLSSQHFWINALLNRGSRGIGEQCSWPVTNICGNNRVIVEALGRHVISSWISW